DPPTPLPPPQAPQGPKEPTIPSVRGDRTATGGLKKPKLTEAELSAKMSSLTIKNAARTAAYERAEADAASFAEREAKSAEAMRLKQKAERQSRQVMMGERERNRQRKMGAMGGREWDAEKNEADFAAASVLRGARRGAHGGV
ncbi:hypothetical protein LTR16_012014, partial [Cryomyces antarcticus]